MARHNRFVILVSERERQAIETLAQIEKLPASTLARKRLLTEAEARGIFMAKGNGDAQVSEANRVAVAA